MPSLEYRTWSINRYDFPIFQGAVPHFPNCLVSLMPLTLILLISISVHFSFRLQHDFLQGVSLGTISPQPSPLFSLWLSLHLSQWYFRFYLSVLFRAKKTPKRYGDPFLALLDSIPQHRPLANWKRTEENKGGQREKEKRTNRICSVLRIKTKPIRTELK